MLVKILPWCDDFLIDKILEEKFQYKRDFSSLAEIDLSLELIEAFTEKGYQVMIKNHYRLGMMLQVDKNEFIPK